MKEEKTTLLRQHDDRRHVRGMAVKPLAARFRAVRNVAADPKRSAETATAETLRADQLHMKNSGMHVATFNVQIMSLRLAFCVTRGRDELKRHKAGPSRTAQAASGAPRRGDR